MNADDFPRTPGERVMKSYILALMVVVCATTIVVAQESPTPSPLASTPQQGMIVGTVTDVNGDTVPQATVVLEGAAGGTKTAVSNDNGFFEFRDLEPGTDYTVSIRAEGFATWSSSLITLRLGQYFILSGIKLHIEQAVTTVTVASTVASPEEIAAEQLRGEEQQRLFGFIPNFYVVYDANAAPLTPKLKFQLASKVVFDPVTIAGVAVFAGINQAGNVPNYQQGFKGYGERFGAAFADSSSDIIIGGAILPSLLHQDPRYFYQGTGTTNSRLRHALLSPFICKGDDGHAQPNYSTVGGDLASAALTNAYYPRSNRGAGLFLTNFFIDTGQRALANVAQEFVLRRLTPRLKDHN
jgi:hypothetical protein